MRKFLTLKMSTSFWALLAFLLVGNVASAQDFFIEFVSPANIAGVRVKFQPGATTKTCNMPEGVELTSQLCDPILGGDINDAGNVQFPFAEPLNGNVGVTKRGTFSFDTKAANTEFNGGSGSIIINNDEANPDATIGMAQTEGAFTIWSVMVSFNSGKYFLDNPGCTFKIIKDGKYPLEGLGENDVVHWGNESGQGDFATGLGDWESVGIACGGPNQDASEAKWEWSASGSTSWHVVGQLIGSDCNGAVFFNSARLTNFDGNGNNNGPCWDRQQAELISPRIDLSALPEGTSITLRFDQMVAQFDTRYWVGYSSDDGATWKEIEINGALDANTETYQQMRVKLAGLEMTENVRVKFRIDARYYFWIIDNVKLIEPEDFNGKLDEKWMSNAPYPLVPAGQSVPVKFMTDVHNVGGKDLTGMKLSATITDGAGSEVYSASYAPTSPGEAEGTVISGDTIQNRIFGSFTPTDPGDYTITYKLTSDQEDFDLSDNEYTKTFTVSDAETGEWSRENEITRSLSILFEDTENVAWMYGNVFRAERDGDNVKSVKFGMVNAEDLAAAEATVSFYIFEMSDDDGDYQITENERRIVGYNFYDVSVDDPDELYLDMPILDFETEEPTDLVLQKGKWYLLGLDYAATPSAPRLVCYWLASQGTAQDVTEYIGVNSDDYVPTNFFMKNWNLSSTFSLSPIPDRSFFTGTPVPYARFVLGPTSGTKNLKLASNTFSVFPTNTADNVSVKFNFDNATDVTTEIYNVNGNRVYSNKMQNQKDQTKVIETSNLAPGAYFVRVTTPNGALSKPFNVIK